jgi:hypothetical protein
MKSEREILADDSMSPSYPRGLFRRTGYFCIFRWSIRGGAELHALRASDFTFGRDEAGKYVQYHERSSKNRKFSMKRFQPEHLRQAIKIYDEDTVNTFEAYYRRRREGME